MWNIAQDVYEKMNTLNSVFKILSFVDSYPFNPSSHVLHTLQSAIPTSKKLIEYFNSAYVAREEKFTTFVQDRVFSKKISLHEPLNKHLIFVKESNLERASK